VPNAHNTKANRIWWAVGMKISSGCGKQELYDRIDCRVLQFSRKYLRGSYCMGFTARDGSRAAGCETYRRK